MPDTEHGFAVWVLCVVAFFLNVAIGNMVLMGIDRGDLYDRVYRRRGGVWSGLLIVQVWPIIFVIYRKYR